MKQPTVYIMASGRNGTIYVGVTSNLGQRVWQHREGVMEGFTQRYGCKLLVWFEVADTMEVAIARKEDCVDRGQEPALARPLRADRTWMTI